MAAHKRKSQQRRDMRPSTRQIVPRSGKVIPVGYMRFLNDLKARIRAAQVKAALSVNRELISLYWHIGESIVSRQRDEGWGKAVVERLAADLQREFSGVSGFSTRNIWRMRAFYLAWTEEVLAQAARETTDGIGQEGADELDGRNLPQPAAEIPWFHNVILLEKVGDPFSRLWYVRQTIQHGWSRAVLAHQIESGLHERQGKALTNFDATLPRPQSDLAQQTVKDPYVFDFLTLHADAQERELEGGLLLHIRKFLLELGAGFAFVGQQVHLEVDGEDFYLDLLFYHLRLRCFAVIDLKMEAFKPEFAGKMNFYLAAVDAQLRHRDDQPSIGLILCKTRKKLIAEYALKNTKTPIGVSEYRLTRVVPADLKASLPTIAELERELSVSKDQGGITP